jgi:hypothetical protein
MGFYKPYLSRSQIHQMIFQHLLYFYQYEKVEELLSNTFLDKFFISSEVVKVIVLDNTEKMLKRDLTRPG